MGFDNFYIIFNWKNITLLLWRCFDGSGKLANVAVKGSSLLFEEVDLKGSFSVFEKALFSVGSLPSVESFLVVLPSKRSVELKKSVLWNGSVLVELVFDKEVWLDVDLNGPPEKKSSEDDYKVKR